jgi:hypothetical protein
MAMAELYPSHRVTNVAAVAPHTLRVGFADGSSQTINFEPMLRGELYGPLRDVALFSRVQIDPEVHTLVWPNGADFDPATLHDWPEYGPKLIAQAQQWESAPVSP